MFLKEYNINEETINEIRRHNGDAVFSDLCVREEETKEIIDYLMSSNIEPIEELLLYKIDLFFMDINDLKNIFEKPNKEEIVNRINEDFFTIDELL